MKSESWVSPSFHEAFFRRGSLEDLRIQPWLHVLLQGVITVWRSHVRKRFSARSLAQNAQYSPIHPSRAAEAHLYPFQAPVLSIYQEIPCRRGSRWVQLRFHGRHTPSLLFKAPKCYPWTWENGTRLACWCLEAGIQLLARAEPPPVVSCGHLHKSCKPHCASGTGGCPQEIWMKTEGK